MDESFSALAAQKTAEHGIPLLDSGRLYNGTYAHTYLLAVLIKLFGTSEFILRLPSAIFGTLSIILIYLFSAKVFKSKAIGLIAAVLMTFGYFDIAWSRQIRMYTEAQFFYLMSLYFLYHYLTESKSSWKQLILSGITGFIAILTHKLCLLIFPAYLILLIFFRSKKDKLKASIPILLLTFAVAVIVRDGIGIFNFVWSRFSGFHFYIYDYCIFLFYNHFFEVLLLSIGIFFAARKKDRNFLIPSVIFIAYLVILSADKAVGMRYFFIFIPFLYMSAAYGAVNLWQCKCFIKKAIILLLIIASVWMGNFVILPRTNYFLEYDPMKRGDIYMDYTPQPNFKAVYDVIKKDSSKNDVFIVAHSAIHEWYMLDSNYYQIKFSPESKASFRSLAGVDGKKIDLYTGAPILDSLENLKKIMENKHGYAILDYISMDNNIDKQIIDYIKENNISAYFDQLNPKLPWTTVWVYKF